MRIPLLFAALSFTLCNNSSGQIVCVLCYHQNDSISSGVNNLLLNGGFENTTCDPSTGIIGTPTSFCPNSNGYSCDFANWTCTGGGSNTYACLYNDSINKSIIIEGTNAAYFGNFFANPCSPISDDTSCFNNVDCTVTGIPPGYPTNPDMAYGGGTGVSLQQTVNGLVPGNTYVLEFWAGGEEYYLGNGLFAVDVGFGDTLLRNRATGPGDSGTIYIIEFNATSPSHTIKFTNWGHICSSCTELVLDNVRLYTLAELSDSVPSCFPSIVAFGASNHVVCEKFCINYLDSSTNNPTAWQWLFEGGIPSSSTDQNPTNICYNLPGIYDVTLITTNATGTDTLTLNDYITVNPTPPIPTITQAGYTLTSSPAPSYQWQLNTIDIPGATDQSYTISQSGYYTVIVGDSNGCTSSFTEYILISGINDAFSDENISIYPNPSPGSFTIGLPDEVSTGEVSIDIINTLGQKVFSSTEFRHIGNDDRPGGSHSENKVIDLSKMTRGIYFIEVKTPNGNVKKKLILI